MRFLSNFGCKIFLCALSFLASARFQLIVFRTILRGMRNSTKNKKKQIRILFIDQSYVLPKIQFGLSDKKAMEDLIQSRFGTRMEIADFSLKTTGRRAIFLPIRGIAQGCITPLIFFLAGSIIKLFLLPRVWF